MSAAIELPRRVDAESVEWAYKRAKVAQQRGWIGYRDQGWRAIKANNPKLMLVLDKAAEVITAQQEHQLGRTQRDSGTMRSERSRQTPVALLQEALAAADRGEPIPHFSYIYAAFAELAGVVHP